MSQVYLWSEPQVMTLSQMLDMTVINIIFFLYVAFGLCSIVYILELRGKSSDLTQLSENES
jgi:hypothetical protein